MFTLRSGILMFAVLVCAAGALGATDLVTVVAASSPAPDHDGCGEEHPSDDAPCSGASDGCCCSCCPLPVLAGTGIPLVSAAPMLLLRPSVLAACSSRTGPPPDHPPK